MVSKYRRKAMKIKTLFIINAVVALVFGLAFVFLPVQTLSLYGSDPVGGQFKFVGQLFGSSLVMVSLISWAARHSIDSNARNAIVFGFFVGDAIGFLIALINQISGVVNAMGWSTVIIYLLLAAGFGYYHFTKSGE